MHNPETDDVHTVGGEYREVRRPERLVYTWAWEGPSSEPNETVVTVEFHDRDGATEVVLMHEGFSSEESRGAHEHGWHTVLDHPASAGARRCLSPLLIPDSPTVSFSRWAEAPSADAGAQTAPRDPR